MRGGRVGGEEIAREGGGEVENKEKGGEHTFLSAEVAKSTILPATTGTYLSLLFSTLFYPSLYLSFFLYLSFPFPFTHTTICAPEDIARQIVPTIKEPTLPHAVFIMHSNLTFVGLDSAFSGSCQFRLLFRKDKREGEKERRGEMEW